MTDNPQIIQDPLRHATWRTYTPADGLAGLFANNVIQDRAGFLWFATDNGGACRFDGEELRSFTREDGLCGNHVLAILEDREGRLWFGTQDGGACWYDGKEFHHPQGHERAFGRIARMLEGDDGRIWMWGAGLCVYDGEEMINLAPEYSRQCGGWPGFPWGLAQDRSGDIWLGSGQLVRFDGERLHPYGAEEGLPGPGEGGYTMARDESGDLWVGHASGLGRCGDAGYHSELEVEVTHTYRIHCDREGGSLGLHAARCLLQAGGTILSGDRGGWTVDPAGHRRAAGSRRSALVSHLGWGCLLLRSERPSLSRAVAGRAAVLSAGRGERVHPCGRPREGRVPEPGGFPVVAARGRKHSS